MLTAIVLPRLGAPAENAAYAHLAGNAPALPGVLAMLLVAGVAAEIVYRGFLFERVRAWLGPGSGGVGLASALSATAASLAHLRDQGMLGVAQSATTGVAFAVLFARRRSLGPPIAALLAEEIERALPEAKNWVWHAHPVWFLDGNPIVGYSKLKDSVRLLFWSGQSFKEKGLCAEGSFKAAEARYTSAEEVDPTRLRRWLAESRRVQWDYKNIVRRKGQLVRLKIESTPATTRTTRRTRPQARPQAPPRLRARASGPVD